MAHISDSDLHTLVERVVRRTLHGEGPVTASTAVPATTAAPVPQEKSAAGAKKVVAIGSDHGGYALKEVLKKDLVEMGYEVMDAGTNSNEACDYPDFALTVAQQVAAGKAWRGIMIDGAGIGSCMVANKVPGVRAGMAYDHASALNSREHNDANLLTLGAGMIGVNLARQIVRVWLTTEFGGGRHAPRVAKITAVETQYLK